jgi:site-specific recombinase XerD
MIKASPLPEPSPHIERSFEAYIYSHTELQRLLDATQILKTSRFQLEPLTVRTLLLVLYGAGLRASEGLNLRCCDVDLDDKVLTIWDSKFFKSRLVPIGTALTRAMNTYRMERRRLPMSAGLQSTFFVSCSGNSISLASLENVFSRLREYTGILRPPQARWQPRLHDLRHAFAVHRLIAWYREGADVQACLPLLAIYMGHIDLSGTQTYLTMTPELLAEASRRFERYSGVAKKEKSHE